MPPPNAVLKSKSLGVPYASKPLGSTPQESRPPSLPNSLAPIIVIFHHFAGLYIDLGPTTLKLPWRRPADHHDELVASYLQRT